MVPVHPQSLRQMQSIWTQKNITIKAENAVRIKGKTVETKIKPQEEKLC